MLDGDLLLLTPFNSASLASTLVLTLASTGMLEAWADPARPMPMMQVKRASLKRAASEYILANSRGRDHELLASLPTMLPYSLGEASLW